MRAGRAGDARVRSLSELRRVWIAKQVINGASYGCRPHQFRSEVAELYGRNPLFMGFVV